MADSRETMKGSVKETTHPEIYQAMQAISATYALRERVCGFGACFRSAGPD
jgi:hypothetical protein